MYVSCLSKANTSFHISGVVSFQVQESLTPSLPVLGSNGFVLRLDISITVSGESLQAISLQRKRSTDSDFVKIVSFPAPSLGFNYTLIDTSLTSRTAITQPTTDASTGASLMYLTTECSDIAEYKWIVSYYYQGSPPDVERISDVKIQGNQLIQRLTCFCLSR